MLELDQDIRLEHGFYCGQQLAPVGAGDQLAFVFLIRVPEFDPHQEAVELRLREWKGADLVGGVLRGDDKVGRGQRMRIAVHGYLALFHRLEQRALRFRGRAIDFVRQDQLCKYRARLKLELAAFLAKNRHADDVRRQQVARKLYSLVAQAQHAGQGLCEYRFAESWQVLDEQMASCQEAGQGQRYFRFLAEDYAVEGLARGSEGSALLVAAQW